ncbi:MAG TPA: hypothetical protein VK625_07720, partial [Flavitalea sp.]|nr:hypothetical protein [Flavitalea sp.]
AAELAKDGYQIVTGFGKGVGTYVVNGVLTCMQNENTTRLDRYVKLRPFPLINENSADAVDIKRKYRESIIREAGIAIFVFGNKRSGEKLINSPGVMEEFRLAVENGLKVIPIASTGYMSRIIYDEILTNFKKFYPEHKSLKKQLLQLNPQISSHAKIISTVKNILSILNKF